MGDEITSVFPNFYGCTVKFGNRKLFGPAHYWAYNYLFMLGLKLINVSKKVPKWDPYKLNYRLLLCSEALNRVWNLEIHVFWSGWLKNGNVFHHPGGDIMKFVVTYPDRFPPQAMWFERLRAVGYVIRITYCIGHHPDEISPWGKPPAWLMVTSSS